MLVSAGAQKAPFPWFGGKSQVAAEIWARLGRPAQYIEPFCGSAAVLLTTERAVRMTRYFRHITPDDLPQYVALGWVEVGRDVYQGWRISVTVMLEVA